MLGSLACFLLGGWWSPTMTKSMVPAFARRLVTAFAIACAGAALAQTDADLLAARAAYDKGDRAKLAAIAPRLSSHVLAPYVAYWQLRLGLDDAPPEAIRSYLDRYPNTPLADRLRIDWLKLLARRALWSRFGADYAAPASDDVELACYNILFKWQRDGESALADALPLWFTGSTTPDACEPAFTALVANGSITAADRRARFRLASEAGNLKLAQAIGGDLSAKDRIADLEFNEVNRDPLGALTKGNFPWNATSGRDLALLALERAAKSDAGATRAAWVKWRDRLPEADRRYGNGRLAYYAAKQLNPSANEWFREAGDRVFAPTRRPGACARRCGRSRGTTCSPRSTPCPSPSARSRPGVIGALARSSPKGSATRGARSSRRLPTRRASTGCSPSSRRASVTSFPSVIPSSPHPARSPRSPTART